MNRLKSKVSRQAQRLGRTRSNIHGTSERPRLSVQVSNLHVHAQLINDDEHKTIVASTTVGSAAKGSMSEKAAWVGSDIAKKAKAKKVNKVVFDRGHKMYHGRVKALADAAREAGLEF